MPLKEVRISNALQYITTKNIPQIPQTTPKATYDSQPKKNNTHTHTHSQKKTNYAPYHTYTSRCQWSQGQQSDSRHLQHQKVGHHEIVVETWKRCCCCCCCCCPSLTAFCCIGTLYPSRAREASQITVPTRTSKHFEKLNRAPTKKKVRKVDAAQEVNLNQILLAKEVIILSIFLTAFEIFFVFWRFSTRILFAFPVGQKRQSDQLLLPPSPAWRHFSHHPKSAWLQSI